MYTEQNTDNNRFQTLSEGCIVVDKRRGIIQKRGPLSPLLKNFEGVLTIETIAAAKNCTLANRANFGPGQWIRFEKNVVENR